MAHYETTIIIPPILGETDLEGVIAGVEKELGERFGGREIVVNRWGKKALAYPIKRFNEGYYVHYVYESDSETCVPGLESRLRINESIMRFLTIRRDEERRSEEKMKQRNAKRRKHGAGEESDISDTYDEDIEME
jgi:small subunit ribosomal protein S6